MNQVLEEFSKIGIVPVIALDDASDAKPLAQALIDGGLPCAEITFRTEAAEESIRIMASEFPEMLVGAGTVLTTEQAERAADAGAKFIVSPGLNPKVVKYCTEKSMPIIPGCANPSDIEQAMEFGLDVVKFFPAEANGGLLTISALSAPYPKLKFMPTGGITAENVKSYLGFQKIIACGGSWMVNRELVKRKDWAGIRELTEEAVSVMLEFTVKHIERKNLKDGTKGCITVGVNSVERAVYHLKRQGLILEESDKICVGDGSLTEVYLKEKIAGFAIHLLEN